MIERVRKREKKIGEENNDPGGSMFFLRTREVRVRGSSRLSRQ